MFKSILVPIDLAQESSWRFVIPEAIELAKAGNGKLTAMTVVRDMKSIFEGVALPFQLERTVADARKELAAIAGKFRTDATAIAQDVRFGSIGREILAAAKAHSCDLIVMASHRPEVLDYLIGPNAAHVAQHAPCSVLVLRKYAAN
jgi:universal stress protein F